MEKINKLTVNGQSYILSDAETAKGLTQETAARQTGDETTLQEAKNYTDTAANTLLSKLNKEDTVTLQKAKSYTEEKCAQLETQVAGVGEQIVTESASRAEADAWLQAQINTLTPGEERAMELIKTITITEENTRAAIFDDNFCLRKFILKAHFAGVSGQTTRNITFSMMEKLDDGTYHVFYTMAGLSGVVDNSPRYITIWGDMPVGAPMMLQMSRVSQYPNLASVAETHPYPNVVEKGLTRLFFVDSDKSNLPVGSKFELWGVRV